MHTAIATMIREDDIRHDPWGTALRASIRHRVYPLQRTGEHPDALGVLPWHRPTGHDPGSEE